MKFDTEREIKVATSERKWPEELPDAPPELLELIKEAMIDFGPDGHIDGYEEIGALVQEYYQKLNADLLKAANAVLAAETKSRIDGTALQLDEELDALAAAVNAVEGDINKEDPRNNNPFPEMEAIAKEFGLD